MCRMPDDPFHEKPVLWRDPVLNRKGNVNLSRSWSPHSAWLYMVGGNRHGGLA